MDVMHERVAGLDVHKATIVGCVRIMVGGKASRECRTFETTTAGLEGLRSWLTESGCTHVAMEATGVYWKPVWNILSEGKFELMVANAAHIKNVPGRKTDINDATWIADLVSCGLIKASFVPEQEIQELRSLLRARKQVTREQSSQIQRIQKTLEEANIKLDTVISDILGVSGRRMIEAMIEGVRNPFKLVELADRRIKASPKVLYDALHGRLTDHHRFMLRLYLRQYDALAGAIAEIDQEIDAAIERMDAGGGRPSPLSLLDLSAVHNPRCRRASGADHPCRNRHRYEPLSDRRPSAGLGRPMSGTERERRQTQVLAPAQRRSLAQDRDGTVRLGCHAQEGQLLQGAVQSSARQTRRKKKRSARSPPRCSPQSTTC